MATNCINRLHLTSLLQLERLCKMTEPSSRGSPIPLRPHDFLEQVIVEASKWMLKARIGIEATMLRTRLLVSVSDVTPG